MPITELAIPPLKQDQASRELFTDSLWPTLATLVKGKKGLKFNTIGLMVISNDLDVSSVFQPVLGLEWEAVSDFQAVVSGEEFAAFRARLIPIVSAIVFPQLYETNVGPATVFGSPLTEVFKVKIGDNKEKEDVVKEAWQKFLNGIGEVESLNGVSQNVEERTFMGAIGWESEQEREATLKKGGIEELKTSFGSLETFVVKFGGL
ncbi:uncharacterized protein LY89DRAFT_784054 [Mollisia scopiformis]|uniref:Uncharacterized protein n=1 Tax=Mollisia scopiformis TaxID=149040 RepID=A0A194X4M5_MOLSC|nr:uncharacterized protein LY89DRAFT_784054 [Mollisia scopiformis]KUJ15019.1 hypothetical protein LY89DRAFT_784054 [Mollisia scopiformis]